MRKHILSLFALCLTTGLNAQVLILSDDMSSLGSNWSMIGTPTGMAASSITQELAGGNPGEFAVLTAGPLAGPDFVGFRYEVSGLDFGLGPVTVSFDGRIQNLLSAATHVRINGNFHGAIMGSFNDTTWSNYSQTYDLSTGFTGTDTLTMDFEFGLGAVDPTGGVWEIDNIQVSTSPIPEPSTVATIFAVLALGFVIWRRRR